MPIDHNLSLGRCRLLKQRIGGPTEEIDIEVKLELGGSLVLEANVNGHVLVEPLEELFALAPIESLKLAA